MINTTNQNENNNDYDAIVIGSGLGGLTTAGILSKLNKKRVLVLEKHYEPGGLTHEFKRGSYSWDVGLHYVGNMKLRLLDIIGWSFFKYLTNDRLKWNKMSDPFEKIFMPGLTLNINSSVKGYMDELIKNFPENKKEIKKYISDIHKIRLWYIFYFFSCFLYPPVSFFFKLLSKINRKKALMTTGEYMNKYITDVRLKNILSARWGNYGIPPSESAFAVHAVIEHHYYNGGVFPDGGAEKISTLFEETIEESGGKILINREVTEIILRDEEAVGVRVRNLAGHSKEITEYYAPVIISDAGVQNTFLKLLPENLGLKLQKELKNFKPHYSGVDFYLGLKNSPETLGIRGENNWIIDGNDFEIFNINSGNIFDAPKYCFLSFPSYKSRKPGGHTADIVAIFPYSAFEKWEKSSWKKRSGEYYELKERVINNIIALVDKYVPGFSSLVVYREMATPLTFRHFTSHSLGNFYGLPAVPERFKISRIEVKTPVRGLYLTGQDILCNGIAPALLSGMATASYLNGSSGILRVILKSLFYSPQKPGKKTKRASFENASTEDKAEGTLIEKKEPSGYLVELTYSFEKNLNILPGQHVKLLAAEAEWRSYSIARSDIKTLTLIIDTRPGGHGSKYAKEIKISDKSMFRLPISDLVYNDTNRRIMFIATGTGLVPFLHMMDSLKKNGIKQKITVLFGCLKDEDNYLDKFICSYEEYFELEKIVCIENPSGHSPYFRGRVTDYLKSAGLDFREFDFYICGHPNMTQDTASLLRKNGADRIFW